MVLSSSITVARMVGLRAWTVHAFGCEKFRFFAVTDGQVCGRGIAFQSITQSVNFLKWPKWINRCKDH